MKITDSATRRRSARALDLSSRNARVRALQDRWSMLRTRLAKLMEARVRDLAKPPGGFTSLLIRCGSPALPVYKVDAACCPCSPNSARNGE